MSDRVTTIDVPRDEALRLCAEMQAEHRQKWYKLALWQCWGCTRFSHGDPAKMCGGIVACNLVTARYQAARTGSG
jgi:hypothetical protein